MKYPFVIFYRLNKYSYIDSFFLKNSSLLDCTIYITNSENNIKKMYDSNFHILITYGDSESFINEYKDEILKYIPINILLYRHIHITLEVLKNKYK